MYPIPQLSGIKPHKGKDLPLGRHGHWAGGAQELVGPLLGGLPSSVFCSFSQSEGQSSCLVFFSLCFPKS